MPSVFAAKMLFSLDALKTTAAFGTRQCLFVGLNPFSVRYPQWAKKLSLFFLPADTDLALPGWSAAFLNDPGFSSLRQSFCSMINVLPQLPPAAFARVTAELSLLLPDKSSFVFDYPVWSREDQNGYTLMEIEGLLARQNFLIYEHLTEKELADRFGGGEALFSLKGKTACCLAVKNSRL